MCIFDFFLVENLAVDKPSDMAIISKNWETIDSNAVICVPKNISLVTIQNICGD